MRKFPPATLRAERREEREGGGGGRKEDSRPSRGTRLLRGLRWRRCGFAGTVPKDNTRSGPLGSRGDWAYPLTMLCVTPQRSGRSRDRTRGLIWAQKLLHLQLVPARRSFHAAEGELNVEKNGFQLCATRSQRLVAFVAKGATTYNFARSLIGTIP